MEKSSKEILQKQFIRLRQELDALYTKHRELWQKCTPAGWVESGSLPKLQEVPTRETLKEFDELSRQIRIKEKAWYKVGETLFAPIPKK